VLEVAAGTASGAGAAYVFQRVASRRWRVGEEELAASGRTLPPDLRHHFVPVSDGGRIHVVERAARADGDGTTTVLLHGIALGVATWAPQLRRLPGRVVAVTHRGHGQSRAGSEGYAFARLGADVLEVLAALDVRDAVLCAHSMGGMVAQLVAADRADELARHVRRLVLVATAPRGPAVPPLGAELAAGALARAERRGRGPFPKEWTVWLARLNFGAHPKAADVELVRSLLDAMSPAAFAALVPPLLGFDVGDRLGSIALATHVVVGTRDLQTPVRLGRSIAERVPVAELTVFPGCGHMVMLERSDELAEILV
jgi:pimeloyl-ACP methyl ester carboxylesterase